MDNTITVSIKHPFGQERIYPVCPTARAFCELTGTKTLSRQNIKSIKALGYAVIVEQKPVKL